MAGKRVFNDEQVVAIQTMARRVFKNLMKDGKSIAEAKKALGYALKLSPQSIGALLNGSYRPGYKPATALAVLDGVELDELLAPFADDSTPEDRPSEETVNKPPTRSVGFKNLDVCLSFYASKKYWHPWTVAAARAGFFGTEDLDPAEWAPKLDALEKVLDRARKVP